MRRVCLSVLMCAALLVPAAAEARPGTVSSALLDLAAVPAQRLVERLTAGHARVDAALSARKEKSAAHAQAARARDAKAAQIAALKAGGVDAATIRKVMSDALVLDERATVARSQLLAAEAEVAARGAELLQLYEAILVEKRREAMRSPKGSATRSRAVKAFRALSEKRDGIRRALLPVLRNKPSSSSSAVDEVVAQAGDDIETLLEKADLARDLEERFMRRAESVRKRIIELEAERAVARDVVGMVRSNSLFDETDRRLFVNGPAISSARTATPGLGIGAAMGAQEEASVQAPPPAANDNLEIGDSPDPANPSDPNDRTAGVDGTDDGLNNFNDADQEQPGGGGGVDLKMDGTAGRAADVGQAVTGVATEQVFEGLGGGGQARLNALLARDDLSLAELKELEARLRTQAKKMRRENKNIRARIGEQMKR